MQKTSRHTNVVTRLNLIFLIFSFNLGYLDRALNNPDQEGPLLGLAKSIYYVYVINRTNMAA